MNWSNLINNGQVRVSHRFTPVWPTQQAEQGDIQMEHLVDMKLAVILLGIVFFASLLAFAVVKKI